MEAKDTVMLDEQIEEVSSISRYDKASFKKVAEAQAEISFKAGIRKQLHTCLLELTKADGANDLKTLEHNITELIYDWQAKLKEWGIK